MYTDQTRGFTYWYLVRQSVMKSDKRSLHIKIMYELKLSSSINVLNFSFSLHQLDETCTLN